MHFNVFNLGKVEKGFPDSKRVIYFYKYTVTNTSENENESVTFSDARMVYKSIRNFEIYVRNNT